jgi:ribose transport system substrate-binding protein
MATSTDHSRYIVKSLIHASRVLAAFHSRGEVLRLKDVVERTGLGKGMCFRLLYTLHLCGFLEKLGGNQYRLISEMRPHRKHRLGYAGQGQDTSFPQEVQKGLAAAAEAAQAELLVVDNRYDPKVALRNAEHLIREQVELAIEFQTDESAAAAIAAKYMDARVPMIAIDIPHPGATYFGANNYEAGLIGGRHLGRWARKHWDGNVDEVLLLGLNRAGPTPQTRIRGMLTGIKETLRLPEDRPVLQVDGDGQFKVALDIVRKHLRLSRSKRILVGAANDPSALGALRAFEEAGRVSECAVAGQNCEPEARCELRRPNTRLIGSVAYFPEKYGEGIIRLALDILAHKPTPPAVFMKHQLVTPDDVDDVYPNDYLLGHSGAPLEERRPA